MIDIVIVLVAIVTIAFKLHAQDSDHPYHLLNKVDINFYFALIVAWR